MNQDTIAAVATPPGEGAIAIIRISGKEALAVGQKIFSRSIEGFQTHTVHYGSILNPEGSVVDHVLLMVMKSPHSYTGEDSVEIFCHGGQLITRRVLEQVLQAGARPANPGEFSLRAYLNGKLDLAQAEAVQELIAAKSELALQNAEKQLQGALSKKIGEFQHKLTDIAAILEAWVDFPEEGLEFAGIDEVTAALQGACEEMKKLQNTFHDGKALHEGFSLCLIGAPNVGKSSLMNALLGKERAIVTDIPGTTRDLLEEDLRLGQIHFKLIDTAGIRDTEETIEKEGIRRSQTAMKEADLILLVLDASRPLSDADRALCCLSPKEKTLVVWNKIDAATPPQNYEGVAVSALERRGLDALKSAIERLIWKEGLPSKEEILITKLRHYQALTRAAGFCEAVISGLKSGTSPEFAVSDLRAALHELGSIVGTNVTEDILSAIFSRFCVGK